MSRRGQHHEKSCRLANKTKIKTHVLKFLLKYKIYFAQYIMIRFLIKFKYWKAPFINLIDKFCFFKLMDAPR